MLRVVYIEVCDPFLGCPASGGRDRDRRRQPVCGSEGRCPGEGSTPRFFQRCLASWENAGGAQGSRTPRSMSEVCRPGERVSVQSFSVVAQASLGPDVLDQPYLIYKCLPFCAMAGASYGGPLSSPPQEPGAGHRPGLARSARRG